MVTLEPPELFTVSCKVCELPTCTFPKLKDPGLAARVPGVAPVPDSGTFIVGSEASLIIEILPLADPLDWGANVTLNVLLCPADNVSGTPKFPRLYPVPVAVAWLIVTDVPPEFVTVAERVLLVLTCTVPNPRLEGLETTDPGVTPVPARGTLSEELAASLLTAMLPDTAPEV